MDLYALIRRLHAERAKLDCLITTLEKLEEPTFRRGRRSMGPKERYEVSKRMRNYRAERRKRS
jgi:hypothetical protein